MPERPTTSPSPQPPISLCPLSFVLCPLSFVLCPLSFVLCPLSFVLCPLSFVLCPLSFVLCPLSFVLCPLSFVLCPLSFVLCPAIITTSTYCAFRVLRPSRRPIIPPVTQSQRQPGQDVQRSQSSLFPGKDDSLDKYGGPGKLPQGQDARHIPQDGGGIRRPELATAPLAKRIGGKGKPPLGFNRPVNRWNDRNVEEGNSKSTVFGPRPRPSNRAC